MKTAILISGQARSFARCLASLHWNVFRKLENPEFYVSVAKDADAPSMELLRAKYPNSKVCIETVEQPNLPEPPASLAAHAPYAISSPIQAILRQLWHLSRVWKFYKQCQTDEWNKADPQGLRNSEVNRDADVFIRCRPDLHFHRFSPPRLYGIGGFNDDWVSIPWWGNYGGVNDRFAVIGKNAARAYFEAYDILPHLIDIGCPIHPESIVCAALDEHHIPIYRDLIAEFGAVRMNGEFIHMRPTAQEIAEMSASLCK